MGIGTVCFVIALVMFILAALPLPGDYRLTPVGLAFLAGGHILGG